MTTQSTPLDVLIIGSGIAGPCLAFWLHKLLPSSTITILERAPEPRLGGQAVDIRSAALPIVERMGLLQAIKDKTTTEEGVDFVYTDGKTKASFPASGDSEAQSSKLTIVRVVVMGADCRSDVRVRDPARRHGEDSLRQHKGHGEREIRLRRDDHQD
jgi:2-polyprenyl-6-methoxyphenol hydroxylase-like FAD-dependent oxidoreductase